MSATAPNRNKADRTSIEYDEDGKYTNSMLAGDRAAVRAVVRTSIDTFDVTPNNIEACRVGSLITIELDDAVVSTKKIERELPDGYEFNGALSHNTNGDSIEIRRE